MAASHALFNIFITILGLLVPLLTYLYQKRLFKAEESKLKSDMDAKKSEIQTAMSEEVKRMFETERAKITEEIKTLIKPYQEEISKRQNELEAKWTAAVPELERKLHQIQAGPFHVQMNLYQKNKEYIHAVQSSLDAMEHELLAQDEFNLRRALKALSEDCLPNMNKGDLTNPYQLESKIKAIIERIEKESQKKQFHDALLLLRHQLNQAMSR